MASHFTSRSDSLKLGTAGMRSRGKTTRVASATRTATANPRRGTSEAPLTRLLSHAEIGDSWRTIGVRLKSRSVRAGVMNVATASDATTASAYDTTMGLTSAPGTPHMKSNGNAARSAITVANTSGERISDEASRIIRIGDVPLPAAEP